MSNYSVYQSLIEYPHPVTEPSYQVYHSVVETARPADEYLSVSGALGNNRIDGHVISLKRYAHLCNPPQRGTLILDTSFPREVINPGERIVLFEKGVRVLTGYVTKITRERPSYHWIIDFEDEYTRVINYFIAEDLFFETASSMKYLIRQILDPTGITYQIGGPDWSVAPGARIGLRSAHDALTEVLAYGALYAWCDPNGILRIRTSPSQKYQQNIREPIGIQHAVSTEQTRNDIHVYGGTVTDNDGNWHLVNVASFKEVNGLVVDLKTVVANPLLTNYTDAQRISDYLLRELGSLTETLTFETVGNPEIRIGTSGSLYHLDSTGVVTSGSGPITSIETTIDDKGYIMNVTINERCPRIAGWSQPPNQMRALWIACRGLSPDPRVEKLIWTGDFGLGGQPTYNIVKTIPSGNISAMHVTRDGKRVYLLMTRDTGTDIINELWYSENPYYNDVEWTLIAKSGDNMGTVTGISSTLAIDNVIFGTGAITSMQMIGNDLYLVFRTLAEGFPFQWYHLIGAVYDGASSITTIGIADEDKPPTSFTPSASGTKNLTAAAVNAGGYNSIQFRATGIGRIKTFVTPAAPEFNAVLTNGVSIVWTNRSCGSWWRKDASDIDLYYTGFFNGAIYNRGGSIFTNPNKLPHEYVYIRGDYWGTQYQFVDSDGWLYIGLGGTPSQIFRWQTGTGADNCGCVVCIDKKDPKRLAWIPHFNAVANETARYSKDGGVSWESMTGNWWGSNSEVTNGSRMQSAGDFLLIDAHPTFWSSEIIEDDGA